MRSDFAQVVRFVVTGSTVAAIYVAIFSLLVYSGWQPLSANLLSFSVAVIIQYVVQTCWTFRRPLFEGTQTLKFAVTIGVGVLYSSMLTARVGPALGWHPIVSAGLVAMTLPIINYLSFRLWVYRPSAETD